MVHNSGVVLVSASTTEFEITKHLYKTTDVTAAKNIGRVMAQRCLEAGITRVRWEIKRGDVPKQRVMFTTIFSFFFFLVIQSTLIITDTFGTWFCAWNNCESVIPGVNFSQTSIDGDLNLCLQGKS